VLKNDLGRSISDLQANYSIEVPFSLKRRNRTYQIQTCHKIFIDRSLSIILPKISNLMLKVVW